MTKIGVIGTGAMGRGIMQWAAESGADVIAYDERVNGAEEARAFVVGMLDRAVAKNRMTGHERDSIAARIKVAESLRALASAEIVVEAIIEDIEAKQKIFLALEDVVEDDTILCTNTSSLSVTACAKHCRRPERVAGLHFFNPVPLMRVVEVIGGERTAPNTITRLLELVSRTKHHPIVCSDTPGFVVNHAGRGLNTEGLRIVQEGVASFADVDRVMRECAGFPMGPFELFDLTGLDVSSRVLREIYDSYFQEPRFRPTPLVYRRVEAGLFGRKTGQGFYRYEEGRRVEPEEPLPSGEARGRVFIAADDVPIASSLSSLLAAGGLSVVDTAGAADVVVIAPYGTDATTAATQSGFDASQVVAIDPLFPESLMPGGRITLMSTPITTVVDRVHRALLNAGARVTRIADSPGFITQRILANIVNTACEIAQQRIATPADIDVGVKVGLGYPKGPLALGDMIGGPKILSILSRLYEQTGDPRYRPSLWLRRRAILNVSLTTPA